MSISPAVSVIIPTYNRAHLIGRAIQSVLNQTFKDFEIIVVDDGSTDNTKDIVQELGRHCKCIHYYYLPHRNANVARNFGYKVSTGEFINFLDSDDLMYPNKIAKQINAHNLTGAQVILCKWYPCQHGALSLPQAFQGNDLLHWLLKGYWYPTNAPLYHRSIIEKIGEWDITLSRMQDADYAFRLALLKPYIYVVNDVLCEYFFDAQKSKDPHFLVLQASDAFKVLDKHYNAIRLEDDMARHFAALLYKISRIVYDYDSNVYKMIASRAFKINKNFVPLESRLFRMCYKIFGRCVTEHLASMKRKIKNMKLFYFPERFNFLRYW